MDDDGLCAAVTPAGVLGAIAGFFGVVAIVPVGAAEGRVGLRGVFVAATKFCVFLLPEGTAVVAEVETGAIMAAAVADVGFAGG